MKVYETNKTNMKLVSKLKEIYDYPFETLPKNKPKTANPLEEYRKREYQTIIDN